MGRERMFRAGLGLLALSIVTITSEARAESYVPPDATYDASVCMHPPALDAVTPPNGSVVPANQPHFQVPWGVYRLVDRTTGDEIATELRTDARGYFLVLLAPLTEGAEIALQVSVCDGTEGIVATWTVGAAVPVATSLGTLTFSEVRAYYPSMHSEELAHYVAVSLTPDPNLAPWQREYLWWLAADGPSATPVALDLPIPTHVGCRSPMGRVGAQGFGGSSTLAAELITAEQTATVDCTDPPIHESFGGRALTAAEIDALARARAAIVEAGMPMDIDAFVAMPDAGPATIDAGMASMPTEPDTNGHCSVRAGRRDDRGPLALLGFPLALWIARRARRRGMLRA